MGEVYRARDTRLGREVAIKVLPAEVSADTERLRRFEKEARAASSLNHPNIVTIYEVERTDSTSFIVMELVDGKTLREVLSEGALPVRRLLTIAVQIAEGLARAHSAGIVHRDLKPENVMVTKDGLVKILDFGLAKLAHPEQDGGELTQGPTVSGGTSPGVVMGTVGYMSPEQASGHPVDFRSDQFSLGAVLYEMATGKGPFRRATAAQTLAAIIQDEPEPVAAVNPKVPAPLRWIIERCLAKEPRERYASTEDLARDLAGVRDHLSEAFSSEAVAIAPAPSRRRILYALAIAAAVALLAGIFALGKRAGEKPIPTFQRVTFRRGGLGSARFAPDGRTIVYGARWEGRPMRVYSTRTDSPESRLFDLPPANILGISSSGEMAILLNPNLESPRHTFGTLARVPLAGGAPREILEDVQGADWSPDGKDLAVIRRLQTLGLDLHDPNLAQRRRLEYPIGKALYDAEMIFSPRVSPGGDLVAFFEIRDGLTKICTVDRAGTKKTMADDIGGSFGIAWSPNGDEVWFVADALRAVSLAGRSRLLMRFPEFAVVHDVAGDGRVLLGLGEWRNGIVAVTPGETQERELSWFSASRPRADSPDGKLVLFTDGTATSSGLYVRKIDGSDVPFRLAEDADGTALSPDSKWALIIRRGRKSEFELVPTGPGPSKTLNLGGIDTDGPVGGTFFPDGKRILIEGRERGRPYRSFVQNIEGGPPRPITPEGVHSQAISPDGRLLAVLDPERRILLYPVDGGTPKVAPGPAEPGNLERWSADGRSLFVIERHEVLAKVWRRDMATGRRELSKEIAPADPAGILSFNPFILADGRSYIYGYGRSLSTLYLVQGLK
jgi:Tol biopolymer transport system component